MTPDEYITKKKELENKLDMDKRQIAREYAFSNNPYPIGTVITDHIGSLKIERLQYTSPSRDFLPQCVYYGIELRKDGTPMKKQTKRGVWQENIQK